MLLSVIVSSALSFPLYHRLAFKNRSNLCNCGKPITVKHIIHWQLYGGFIYSRSRKESNDIHITKKVPFLRTLTEVGVSGGELVSLFLLSGLCENTFF